MTTLVVGATGATGRLLVAQLLDRGQHVRAIVRSPDRLPTELRNQPHLSLVQASLLDLDAADLARHVAGCGAVASCLGHSLSFRGIFGPPHRLVTDATRRLCAAIRANAPAAPVKFVLMNTTGNRNRDLAEPIPPGQQVVIGLLRLLLPPHADNEQAADYLRTEVGQDDGAIEWVAVRPDNLINADAVTAYDVHPSPIRSAIFDAGKTSRINVGDFMARLIAEDDLWSRWRGSMPVIYNRESGA
jgi:nucleoside-diphosphate-sugar epimerase